ncbi:hypothetical protein BC567DRAFT_218719, partial [Phyllosticta citribraziliensis]
MVGGESRAPRFRGAVGDMFNTNTGPPVQVTARRPFPVCFFPFSFSVFHPASLHCSGYDAGASSSRWERLAMRLCFEIPTRHFCCLFSSLCLFSVFSFFLGVSSLSRSSPTNTSSWCSAPNSQSQTIDQSSLRRQRCRFRDHEFGLMMGSLQVPGSVRLGEI